MREEQGALEGEEREELWDSQVHASYSHPSTALLVHELLVQDAIDDAGFLCSTRVDHRHADTVGAMPGTEIAGG